MTVPLPNLNHWFPGSKEKLVKYDARQRNLNIYSIDEWCNLLNRIGFQIVEYYYIFDTSGEKLPPYLRLPEKAIAYSVAIKVSK